MKTNKNKDKAMSQANINPLREYELQNLKSLNYYSALKYIKQKKIDHCLFCDAPLNSDLTHTNIHASCLMFHQHDELELINQMNQRIDFYTTGEFLKNKLTSFLDLNTIRHQVYSHFQLPKQYYSLVDMVPLDDVYLDSVKMQDNFLILNCKTQKKQEIKIIFGYLEKEKLPHSIIKHHFFYYFKVDIYNEYVNLEDVIMQNQLLLVGKKINELILQKFETAQKKQLHLKATKESQIENERIIKNQSKRKIHTKN